MRAALHRFAADDRAIEGLPVRLVIAFIVGVASLSVMLNMVSGVGSLTVSELDARPDPEVVEAGDAPVAVTVVDADGKPVADALVIVRSGSARLNDVVTARTDADGRATVDLDAHLGPNQADGTLTVDIKPPAGSQYVDRRENTAILVVAD
ncbi:carboxypeptidase regulatory-like domain-containing protein [Halobacteriaceae archaeon GCM10025711]